jgi:hypothetical protein
VKDTTSQAKFSKKSILENKDVDFETLTKGMGRIVFDMILDKLTLPPHPNIKKVDDTIKTVEIYDELLFYSVTEDSLSSHAEFVQLLSSPELGSELFCYGFHDPQRGNFKAYTLVFSESHEELVLYNTRWEKRIESYSKSRKLRMYSVDKLFPIKVPKV